MLNSQNLELVMMYVEIIEIIEILHEPFLSANWAWMRYCNKLINNGLLSIIIFSL